MLLLWVALFILVLCTSVSAWYCEEPGWREYLGNCYNFGGAGGSFNGNAVDCNAHCAGQGARMLCIEDADREDYVRKYSGTSAATWLDYSDASGTYAWGVGCDNSGYTNWLDPNAPHGPVGDNCAALQADNWYEFPCDTFGAWCYCEKPAIASTPVCPDGWTLSGDVCYLIDVDKPATTWNECEDYCGGYNGRMLCLRDASDESYIVSAMGDLFSVWLSYTDVYSEGAWRWSANCDYTGYTHWDTVHSEPNGATIENCAELYGNKAGSVGWNDAACNQPNVHYPKYCFCEGSSGDPSLLPYTSHDTTGPTAPPSDDSSNSSDNGAIWIIATVVFVFGLLACVGAAYVRNRYHLNFVSSFYPSNSPYAYHGANSSPQGYSASSIGPGPATSPYSAVPPAGYAPGPYAGSTVGMVPLTPSTPYAPSAPPAGSAYAPQGQPYAPQSGYTPVYQHQQQQQMGSKVSSAPASAPPQPAVVVATAVPYSAVGAYGNYGDGQVVVVEAVVASANV